MTLDEFYDQVDAVKADRFPLIVKLKYKYTHETEYTVSTEVLDYYDDMYIWVNDWCEGQQDIQVLTWITAEDAMNLIHTELIKDPNSES